MDDDAQVFRNIGHNQEMIDERAEQLIPAYNANMLEYYMGVKGFTMVKARPTATELLSKDQITSKARQDEETLFKHLKCAERLGQYTIQRHGRVQERLPEAGCREGRYG